MNNETLWQAKLHARLHDPAEKALILMRTEHGHEGGTSRELQSKLFPRGVPEQVERSVRQADRWASAADRAAFPKHDGDERYPAWQRVEFHKRPVIIHPLTGQDFDIQSLRDLDPAHAEALSKHHFEDLIEADIRRTALAYWRFGPALDVPQMRSLWGLLPADTRVPDHTIWDHLDLTAAFAGAFVVDPESSPALLAVSLGPVQDFIAASRSTSDLWAGSHLLSRLAWEAMKVICEELGPEAILFPRLRGIPQVDLWLRDECGLRSEHFDGCDWVKGSTDANPLFAAALPNRFTAIVPANRAKELSERLTLRVRDWTVGKANDAFRKLLDVAGLGDDPTLPGYRQIKEQLTGFPEVHWAAVPWSLVGCKDGRVEASDARLAQAMQPFFASTPPGFLASDAWKLLSQDIKLEEGCFWRPNPGALYPALHELLDRLLAAAKSARPFEQTKQYGFRCSITGEAEWLTTDRSQLSESYRNKTETLWARVAERRPAWTKKGEHLGAAATLKRLWPTLFVEELTEVLDTRPQRFVVSTHTMALAASLARWADEPNNRVLPRLREKLTEDRDRVALPRRLAQQINGHPQKDLLLKLPGWLEEVREKGVDTDIREANKLLEDMLGAKPESYYAIIMLDGDRMGAWLASAPEVTLPHESAFHPQIRQALTNRFGVDPNFSLYAKAKRAANPARHMAISDALNNFAMVLAPGIVEGHYHGRILYAGGDDLMAMLPVRELLPAMAGLRAAYSGIEAGAVGALSKDLEFTKQENGFVLHGGRLLRVMGEKATASMGAVIAHYQTPLGAVLRELRDTEKRAKQNNDGQRDAFSISVLKRSGGALHLTQPWSALSASPIQCLRELIDDLADQDASRRAAYHVSEWSVDLPQPAQLGVEQYRALLGSLLTYQFIQQNVGKDKDRSAIHAQRLAGMAPLDSAKNAVTFVNNFLAIAEFMARDTRN